MIKIVLINEENSNKIVKDFNELDDLLTWYFNDKHNQWWIHRVLEGQEIITGEIKQKGINNK